MSNCEKCGKLIENGAVFCTACTTYFDKGKASVTASGATEIGLDHEVFSFKRKHSSLIAKVYLGFPIILGILVVLIGIVFIIPDFEYLDENTIILPIMTSMLSLLVITQIYRHLRRYPLLFLAMFIFILTSGLAITFTDYSSLLLSIGATFFVLIVVIFLSQQSSKKKVLFIDLALIILAIGASVAVPLYSDLILASCLVLVGFILILGRF
ncbi:MAG: hypothetical protein ACW964_12255 [Candidatus Hodarchaeales archaeon]